MTVLAEARTVTPDQLLDYLTTLLSQFAGGPGPADNNLVRFGLAATFWAVLLFFAWNRQRQQDLPRERLLMLGFGLGFLRDAFMFVHLSFRLVTGTEHDALCAITVPRRHCRAFPSGGWRIPPRSPNWWLSCCAPGRCRCPARCWTSTAQAR